MKNVGYNANILREPNYSDKSENPFISGMPILFPPNRMENGEFYFEGRKYSFPINEPNTGCHLHGFLHTARFEAVIQGENFVRCRYTSDELYGFYPHKFMIEIEYSLSENGLKQETCVFNLSDSNMPVFLGFHTTFNLPFVKDSCAENVCIFAQIGDEAERDISSGLPTGRILPEDEFSARLKSGTLKPAENKISRHYKAVNEGITVLTDAQSGARVVYENDEKFGWRLFYNGGASNFICLEPQSCMVNCMNSSFEREYTGFDFIKSGECKKYTSRIYIEKI